MARLRNIKTMHVVVILLMVFALEGGSRKFEATPGGGCIVGMRLRSMNENGSIQTLAMNRRQNMLVILLNEEIMLGFAVNFSVGKMFATFNSRKSSSDVEPLAKTSKVLCAKARSACLEINQAASHILCMYNGRLIGVPFLVQVLQLCLEGPPLEAGHDSRKRRFLRPGSCRKDVALHTTKLNV